MAELSSGRPPFYNRKHDFSLALEICNGLRPEFGKETPKIYKKLAYECMNANSNERPTAEELWNILKFWYYSVKDSISYQETEKFGYKEKELKLYLRKQIKRYQISPSYEKNSDAIYTSRTFKFTNMLPKPVNSSIITSYFNNEESNKGIYIYM